MIRFTITGSPVGKGRPRFTKSGHAYTPKETKDYEGLVKLLAKNEMNKTGFVVKEDKAFSITIYATYPIPKSWPKKKQEQAIVGVFRPTVKPDLDNVAKIICDSLNGIIWRDDAQVATIKMDKWYGQNPKVEVIVDECA